MQKALSHELGSRAKIRRRRSAGRRTKIAGPGRPDRGGQDSGRPVFCPSARDFAHTDEALRIRRVDQKNYVTYKGPKIDRTTKTRQEIEIDLPPGEQGFAEFAALLAALGFRPVADVRKRRRTVALDWQQQQVEAALDRVEGVGTFVELEIMADDAGLDAARASLAELAARLGLQDSQRRSYLELLLGNLSPNERGG